jgi:hypothetical protein
VATTGDCFRKAFQYTRQFFTAKGPKHLLDLLTEALHHHSPESSHIPGFQWLNGHPDGDVRPVKGVQDFGRKSHKCRPPEVARGIFGIFFTCSKYRVRHPDDREQDGIELVLLFPAFPVSVVI